VGTQESTLGGENMDLIIFIETGVTHRFQEVTNLTEKDGVLEFEYVGVSTQQKRKAKFTGYTGYSVAE
jgi:hypothetical protein